MGCQIEISDTGVELMVHRFDTESAAKNYLTVSRHGPFTSLPYSPDTGCSVEGIQFFECELKGMLASLRNDGKGWKLCIWEDK